MDTTQTKILDAFINGEPIEITYRLLGKIEITFRDPNVKTHGYALRKHSEYVLSHDLTNIEASVYNDYCLLACYIKQLKDVDFVELQAEKYSTKEGFEERLDKLTEMINAPLESLIFGKLKEFQSTIAQAFSDDSLKNS